MSWPSWFLLEGVERDANCWCGGPMNISLRAFNGVKVLKTDYYIRALELEYRRVRWFFEKRRSFKANGLLSGFPYVRTVPSAKAA